MNFEFFVPPGVAAADNMIPTRYSTFFLILMLAQTQPAQAQDSLTEVDPAVPGTMTVPVAEDDLEADVKAGIDSDVEAGMEADVETDIESEVGADMETDVGSNGTADVETGLETDNEVETDEPVMTEEELLQAEFGRFRELLDEGALDEADTSAKRIIELTISTSGPRSDTMAKALTNLAIVQQEEGELEAAQQNFQAAIDIIEDVEDRLNAALVNPLKGLASAQYQSGRPDLATQTYERAVHVTHVNEGPHNLDQIDLLEKLAEVQLSTGNLDGARDIQEMIFAINARRYDISSMEMVPPLMRRASWQHRAGLIYDERATYRRVIRIIEDQVGSDSLQLVEPLILLGRSFFSIDTSGAESFQASALTTGEIYFKRALRIAAESPDSNWNVIADATLALGDYYQQSGDPQRARQTYINAWDLLSERDPTGQKLAKRHDTLEGVTLLRQNRLPAYIGNAQPTGVQDVEDPIRQGTMTLSYSISSRGRVVDLRLIENQPSAFVDLQQLVQRELRRGIYRPRFENGEAVTTDNQVLVYRYYYRQSDLDAARKLAGDDSA